ncbi:hypothetical protein ACWTQZ_26470, partial [Escherichia coli]
AVLLGVDENYPGTATADFADPVLGSVVIQIAASSDSGALTVSTTSSTELRGAAPDDDQKIPRELSSYDPERREIWMQGPGYIRVQSADGQFR